MQSIVCIPGDAWKLTDKAIEDVDWIKSIAQAADDKVARILHDAL